MSSLWIVSVILCSLWQARLYIICTAQCNQLVALTDCVCPGQSVIYQCSVMGGIFTVYSGSAFQCPGGDITLRNDQFGSDNSIGACDSRQISISGRGLIEVDNCYTSQVNISLGEAVSQNTVSCSTDDGLQVSPIDTAVLVPSTDAFPPPSELSLSVASSTYLTFEWNPVPGSCSSLVYHILADNCGSCPNKTSTTSINCTADFSTLLSQNGQMTCMLSVQTVICDGTSAPIAGDNITSMRYTLKVPSAPSLNITPYYDGAKQLIGFNATVILSDPRSFVISEFVDGSTTSFTLTDNCNMATLVPISSNLTMCVDLVCSYYSQMKCSSETTTNVVVYASNILGNGRNSTIERISNENNFVDILFDVEVNPKVVNCVFREQSQNSKKTCTIKLSFNDGHQPVTEGGKLTPNNVVTIALSGLPEGSIAFYSITASNGTYQVVEQDYFQVPRTEMSTNVGGVVTGIIVPFFVVFVLAVVTLLYVILCRDYKLKKMGFIPLKNKDCESNVVGKDTTVKDFAEDVTGEKYNPLLQEVYRKVKEREELPEDVKLIVKCKDKGSYLAINSDAAADKFVDDKRQIRPSEERDPEFKTYNVYAGDKSDTTVPTGTELLYCKNNPVVKPVLGEVHTRLAPQLQQLPPGVEEVNHWFDTIEVEKDKNLSEANETHKRFKDLVSDTKYDASDPNQVGLYFTLQKGQRDLVLDYRRVMALSQDHHLFIDGKKILGQQNMRERLPDWKDIYYEAQNDLKLNARSRVLIYNPSLKRVNIYYMLRASKPVEVLSFVRQKIKASKLEHIYLQRDAIKDDIHIQDGWKFMALNEKDSMFTGSRISDAVAEAYGWKFVFFQVQESIANMRVDPGTLLLYCTE